MRGHHRAILESQFQQTVNLLAADETLPQRYHDHVLTGNWEGYRDCHFRFDLVPIYSNLDGELLELTRLGSHSELGL